MSRRRALLGGIGALLLACGGLAGCGFQPLYGDLGGYGPVAQQLAAIDIGVIAEREGQLMRTNLIERLNPNGRPADPAYTLDVTLTETQRNLGVREDDTSTRGNLTIEAAFVLTDLARGETVYRDTARTITSYNILDDQFATLIAERDARDRAIRATSEQIRTQLALHFAQENTAAP
ncbi:MAG: hypothetical protein RLO50_18020 [Azospirillaceae bacterium]